MIETSAVIILSILTFLFLLKMWMDYNKQKKIKPVMPPVPLNFENDLQFLNYVIDHKLKQTKSFLLEPMKMSGKKIIRDDDFEKFKNDIVEEVFMTLSPNYKRTLYKYFTEEALVTYITEVVFREMMIVSIESNFESLFNKPIKK